MRRERVRLRGRAISTRWSRRSRGDGAHGMRGDRSDSRACSRTDVLVLPASARSRTPPRAWRRARDAMRDAPRRRAARVSASASACSSCSTRAMKATGDGLGIFRGPRDAARGRSGTADRLEHDRSRRRPLPCAALLPIAYYANSYVCRPDESGVRARLERARARALPGDRTCASARSACSFIPRRAPGAGVNFVHTFLHEVHA